MLFHWSNYYFFSFSWHFSSSTPLRYSHTLRTTPLCFLDCLNANLFTIFQTRFRARWIIQAYPIAPPPPHEPNFYFLLTRVAGKEKRRKKNRLWNTPLLFRLTFVAECGDRTISELSKNATFRENCMETNGECCFLYATMAHLVPRSTRTTIITFFVRWRVNHF